MLHPVLYNPFRCITSYWPGRVSSLFDFQSWPLTTQTFIQLYCGISSFISYLKNFAVLSFEQKPPSYQGVKSPNIFCYELSDNVDESSVIDVFVLNSIQNYQFIMASSYLVSTLSFGGKSSRHAFMNQSSFTSFQFIVKLN